jgi:hypothetical protein
MQAPYKGAYSIGDFWSKLKGSAAWATYAAANPAESKALDDVAQKKIAKQAFSVPSNMTNTPFGDTLLMAVLTLNAF